MATDLHLSIRIRTQESQEYSYSGNQIVGIEHSIDSVSIMDQSISMHMMNLHKIQEEIYCKSKKTISCKSHNYITIIQQNLGKKKCISLRTSIKRQFSIDNIPHPLMNQLLSYHRCLNLAKNDFYNRAYGAMFGFLIGDSMGAHIINKAFNENQISQALMMKGGGVMNLRSGQGTDEWELCLSLCQGLVMCKGKYDCNKIAQKYLQWMDSNPFDLPVLMGIAFSDIKKRRRQSKIVDKLTLGQQLKHSSLKNLKQQSSLGLLRIIPLTIWGINLEQYEFNYIIKQQMKLITPNQFVVQSAIIFANFLKCILTTGDHMLAYHQAQQYVYKFGSQKMIQLWSCINGNDQMVMTNLTANNLKFPFVFAIKEIISVDQQQKDLKKQFIQSAANTLSKGFHTDTNCSITLGLIGAVIGYNNIPSFYKNKILNAEYSGGYKKRSRDYHPKRVVDIVASLIRDGPIQLEGQLF